MTDLYDRLVREARQDRELSEALRVLANDPTDNGAYHNALLAEAARGVVQRRQRAGRSLENMGAEGLRKLARDVANRGALTAYQQFRRRNA